MLFSLYFLFKKTRPKNIFFLSSEQTLTDKIIQSIIYMIHWYFEHTNKDECSGCIFRTFSLLFLVRLTSDTVPPLLSFLDSTFSFFSLPSLTFFPNQVAKIPTCQVGRKESWQAERIVTHDGFTYFILILIHIVILEEISALYSKYTTLCCIESFFPFRYLIRFNLTFQLLSPPFSCEYCQGTK